MFSSFSLSREGMWLLHEECLYFSIIFRCFSNVIHLQIKRGNAKLNVYLAWNNQMSHKVWRNKYFRSMRLHTSILSLDSGSLFIYLFICFCLVFVCLFVCLFVWSICNPLAGNFFGQRRQKPKREQRSRKNCTLLIGQGNFLRPISTVQISAEDSGNTSTLSQQCVAYNVKPYKWLVML